MKIDKTILNIPTRKLSSKYTMDISQDLQELNDVGSNLEEILNEEIMHEIVRETLLELGWHHIKLDYGVSVPDSWIREHITHKYNKFNINWYFESKSDATMFALKWCD